MINNISTEELFAPGHRACAGCGQSLAVRFVMKAAGKNTIVSNATGCLEVFSTPYPETSWRVPWIHGAFETAASVASGIDKALIKLKKRKKINLLALAGDGGTFDIGLQALSGAAERGHTFAYVCFDNGAYMNCLSLDSLIMTKEGLKRITDVKLGEDVYAFDQKTGDLVLKRCTGIFDNGMKEVFELNTLHHSIKATSNHPFLVLKRNGRGRQPYFLWKELGELKKNDEVVILKKIKPGKSFAFKPIKVSKKGDYKVNKINNLKLPSKSSDVLMEFLGLYLGDGWVRPQRAEIGFALPKNTKESKRLLYLYKRLFKQNVIQKDTNYIYLYSVNLARFIDSLGFGRGAKNKIVPDWIFTLPDSEKEAFVRGLMSSDGYKIGNSSRYVSASYDLLRTLRLLLQTIGYQVGKIHQQTKKKGTFCVYRELLEDSTYGYICFSKKRNADISKYLSQTKQRDFLVDNENFSTERVTSIRFVKEEPTLDLRVEGEHNFIADGIVVHNTGIQRSGATPKYASTTTTPAGSKVHGKTEIRKNMPMIMAAHGCYVATASVAFPHDLIKKVQKALKHEGVSYVQIFSPCIPGWGIPSNLCIEIAKLAFKTRVSPLFEIENGIVTITNRPSKELPVGEYLMKQGRFKHLLPKEIEEIQAQVDSDWEKLVRLEETRVRIS